MNIEGSRIAYNGDYGQCFVSFRPVKDLYSESIILMPLRQHGKPVTSKMKLLNRETLNDVRRQHQR